MTMLRKKQIPTNRYPEINFVISSEIMGKTPGSVNKRFVLILFMEIGTIIALVAGTYALVLY